MIDDLVLARERILEDVISQTPVPPAPQTGALTIGIPRALSTFEFYPFWHTYFTALGLRPIWSQPTDRAMALTGVELALAQPCFPVQVAHGHVLSLFELGVDYVLAPNIIDAESHADSTCISHFCPWTQTLPFVLKSVPRFAPHADRLLTPTLHFQLGREHVKGALAELARELGRSRRASDEAADAAYAAQRSVEARLLDAGARALAELDRTGAPGLVLVGRAYNFYDRMVNCDIPRKLRRHYGANVIPFDFLVTGRESIRDLHDNMYWASGQRMLQAARIVAGRPNLHLVFVSNFKCGPDSYIKFFTRDIARTPALLLQFDGHGNDGGYLTRCEAYLESKGILRCFTDPAAAQPIELPSAGL